VFGAGLLFLLMDNFPLSGYGAANCQCKTITEVITGIIYGFVSPLPSVLAFCSMKTMMQIGNLTLLVDKPIGPSVRIPSELSRTFHHSLKKEYKNIDLTALMPLRD
jgi:hypothetical protein